jgi:hypothetical protein
MNPRDEKWKVLVVLDGCRYDCFKEANDVFEGKLMMIDNDGCLDTQQWYITHWLGRDNSDTILIHGIHFVDMFGKSFFKAYKMWDYDTMLKIDEQITFAEKVIEKHPDKRILIHFLQSHIPFNNPKGREFLKSLGTSGHGMPLDHQLVTDYGNKNGWEEIKNLYKEEIRYVLEKIKNSKINPDVITSDHGIRIGEMNVYRHGAPHPVVTTVPYLKVKK